jgi:hypothetical protein
VFTPLAKKPAPIVENSSISVAQPMSKRTVRPACQSAGAHSRETAPTVEQGTIDSNHSLTASFNFIQIPVFPPDRSQSRSGAMPLLGRLQRKLSIGQADDLLEHEADRVADKVMRIAADGIAVEAAPLQVSRKCAACDEEEKLQEKPAGLAHSAASEALALVHEVLRSPGHPLDAKTRAYFEPRFGLDFSDVRIHSDSRAADSAKQLNSHAYAVGRNIVFGTGQFAPATPRGRRLVAHELAHVVQQGRGRFEAVLRRPRSQESTAFDQPGFPYPAVLVVDEVALRSSAAGGRSDDRFHNLVASLRQDVVLVVEGSTHGWMKVRVTSGTALDRRTNKPMSAAGLAGYVSRELLVRSTAPKPRPTADPAAYSSLEAFSQAWPDRVTSPEFIEKVWVGQSKEAWTNKALAAAGIKPADWRPAARFRKNKPIFEKVYRYYTNLYLGDNRLKWAAMAKLAGGEVFRGFRDQIVPSEEFGEALSSAGRRDDGALSVGELLGGGYDLYAGSMDIILLQMQKAIFMDLAWQHEAFREGGIKALAAAKARGEIGDDLLAAWQDIDSGVTARINAGNEVLLKREQLDVLQGGGTGGFYGQIQGIPDNNMIPETMSEEARSPIPGGRAFADVVRGGDITKFNDRWKWLKADMIPAFEKLDRATLDRLVQKSLDELADRKF